MSFTKVAPAGIGTEPGTSIRIGDSLLHSTGIDLGSGTGIGASITRHGDATFTGIITASAFFGDGSGLEGVSSSGIGTPLSDDDTSELNKVYYVNQELSIGSTVTVNHPDSAVASYTHYQDLVVKDNADFIVADGDTFIPDVLGINTSSLPNPVSGATGGRIRAGTITNAGANGAPNFPNGLTGTAGTFSSLDIGGVITYEDVTNVDSIGIVTARVGIRIGAGTTVGPVSGVVTYFGDGSQLTGISVDSTKIETGNTKVETIDTGSDGHVKISTEGGERLRIGPAGQIGIAGANYGTAGQVLTSQGSGSVVQWATPSAPFGGALDGLNFGGTETTYTSGGTTYKVHSFTSSGFFRVTAAISVDFLIVGGGGGTAAAELSYGATGGGGAGGMVEGTSITIPVGKHTVTVGQGGAASNAYNVAGSGGDSSFNYGTTITAKGGGGSPDYATTGTAGGSGSGGSEPSGAAGASTQSSQNSGLSGIAQFGNAGGAAAG